MKIIFNSLLLLPFTLSVPIWIYISPWLLIPFATVFITANISPLRVKSASKRLGILSDGNALLSAFLVTCTINLILAFPLFGALGPKAFILHAVIAVLTEAVIFWNGMIRLYLTSVQLRIKWRILGALFGMIPIANLYMLFKMLSITTAEVTAENARAELELTRAENEICKTKYPILLVHGVFFRDTRFFNYWGRIPAALKKNGAEIYYGEQQSAASVADCAAELKAKIEAIVKTTGCEKVNIIAHSKGGLDARYAISLLGADKYVVSLTTINTPHRGCLFADYLLEKAPEILRNKIAAGYNKALLRLGDESPDFLSAVSGLTNSACAEFNNTVLNKPDVYYQSVGSYLERACGGCFPLNFSYHLVKYFDGRNDGLVSVESSKWGESFRLLAPKGKRGISHGDVIDLNRENIPGFDVREFYTKLVSELKAKGF